LKRPVRCSWFYSSFGRETDAEVETVRIIEQFFYAYAGDFPLEQVAYRGLVFVEEVNELALAIAALLDLVKDGVKQIGFYLEGRGFGAGEAEVV
jgi:hypothetical protein